MNKPTEAEAAATITYAFGHLVASYNPEDPHSADSGGLAIDTLLEAFGGESAVSLAIIGVVDTIAEHVAGNYTYTGEADEYQRKIERGEL